MQLITAVMKPHVLDAVKEALRAKGATGLTVSEARGFGRQAGHTETYRGAEYKVEFGPKLVLEVLCDDADVDTLVDVIGQAARTGAIGDGKIWTTPITRLVRIRTGEEGPDAI